MLSGAPFGIGESIMGAFSGWGDPDLRLLAPPGAVSVAVNSDGTHPFSVENLSMLVSVSRAPARVPEPAGRGVLAAGVLVLLAARRPSRSRSRT